MRKRIWLIVLALFISLSGYVIYLDWANAYKRKQNCAIVKGKVLNVKSDIMDCSHSGDITYKILVNGKEITRTKRITCEKSNILFMLFDKNMDVVYDKDDPENCEILLTRNSYREYKLLPSKDVLQVLNALEVTCGAIN